MVEKREQRLALMARVEVVGPVGDWRGLDVLISRMMEPLGLRAAVVAGGRPQPALEMVEMAQDRREKEVMERDTQPSAAAVVAVEVLIMVEMAVQGPPVRLVAWVERTAVIQAVVAEVVHRQIQMVLLDQQEVLLPEERVEQLDLQRGPMVVEEAGAAVDLREPPAGPEEPVIIGRMTVAEVAAVELEEYGLLNIYLPATFMKMRSWFGYMILMEQWQVTDSSRWKAAVADRRT
jgi:hypothetical protein